MYLAIEGLDFCGKDTLVSNLRAGPLQHAPINWVSEPGYTGTSGELRKLITFPPNGEVHDDTTRLLMYSAARRMCLNAEVVPALAAGRHVITNRSVYSTIAYQCTTHFLTDMALLAITDLPIPEAMIYLDIDYETMLSRNQNRTLDVIERSPREFFEGVLERYNSGIQLCPRVCRIDGRLSPEEVCDKAATFIKGLMDSEVQ